MSDKDANEAAARLLVQFAAPYRWGRAVLRANERDRAAKAILRDAHYWSELRDSVCRRLDQDRSVPLLTRDKVRSAVRRLDIASGWRSGLQENP